MSLRKCGITAATILPVMISSAIAADLDRPAKRPGPAPVRAEEPYSPALRWAGLYGGLSAGVAFSDEGGFAGAATLGYNWATPYNLVYGVEGDIGFMDLSSQTSRLGPFWSTFRGRVGYASGSLLPYVTYGVALVEADNTAFRGRDDIQTGWVAGAGVEMTMSEKTSVKFEYLHMDFSNSNSFILEDRVDLIRVGMNMKF